MGSYSFEYSWEDLVLGIKQPSSVSWIMEVYAAFKDRIFCDSKIAADWRHEELWIRYDLIRFPGTEYV